MVYWLTWDVLLNIIKNGSDTKEVNCISPAASFLEISAFRLLICGPELVFLYS